MWYWNYILQKAIYIGLGRQNKLSKQTKSASLRGAVSWLLTVSTVRSVVLRTLERTLEYLRIPSPHIPL